MRIARTLLRLLLLAPLATAACARTRAADPAPNAPLERSAFSVYDLGGAWRDQAGHTVGLESLRGRPRVVAMVYAHCTSTCPLAIAEMKRLEAVTDRRLGLVLVSLDPERDTPDALAGYAREHALDAARWTLLSGSDDAVRDVAATLGVRYRRTTAGELAHSSTLTLLDDDGRVVMQQQGLGDPSNSLAAAVHSLLP